MKITRILLLKIVNQSMENINKLSEKNTGILQDLPVKDTFITVDIYIFIVMAFLGTPLIKNQFLRYVVYKPHLSLLNISQKSKTRLIKKIGYISANKIFFHHYLMMHFYDIPGSGHTFTTYPGCDTLLRHARITHY